MTKNAVIYARYSSDKQNEMSIEGQIAECRKYAKENDLVIIQEYTDRALTATTDRRPGFLKMIDDSNDRNFEVILVYQMDRFARDRMNSGFYKKKLRENGVKVVSAKEYISDDSSGIITEGMLEIFGEYFSAQLSEKVDRGMRQNAEKCKSNGSYTPFGYRVDEDKHYQLDEVNAPIVREVFERVADGDTIKNICEDLNKRGIKTPTGRDFNRSSFQKMLRSEKYKGIYIFSDIRIPGGMPRIVSDELFDTVQVLLDKRTHDRRPAEEDFILTGKLYCGYCGTQLMGTSHTGKKYKYYTCANAKSRGGDCEKKNIRKELIEDEILKRCREALTDDVIEAMVAFVEKQNEEDQNSPEFIRLTKEIQDTESKIEKLLDQVEAGVSSSRIAERLAAREAEVDKLRQSLVAEMRKQKRIDPKLTRNFLQSMRDGMHKESISYKRLFIQLFVDKINLYSDHYEIMLTTANNTGGVSKLTEKLVLHELNDPSSQFKNDGTPKQNRRLRVCLVLVHHQGFERNVRGQKR